MGVGVTMSNGRGHVRGREHGKGGGLKCEDTHTDRVYNRKIICRDSTWAWGSLCLDDTKSGPGLIIGVGNMSIWYD